MAVAAARVAAAAAVDADTSVAIDLQIEASVLAVGSIGMGRSMDEAMSAAVLDKQGESIN